MSWSSELNTKTWQLNSKRSCLDAQPAIRSIGTFNFKCKIVFIQFPIYYYSIYLCYNFITLNLNCWNFEGNRLKLDKCYKYIKFLLKGFFGIRIRLQSFWTRYIYVFNDDFWWFVCNNVRSFNVFIVTLQYYFPFYSSVLRSQSCHSGVGVGTGRLYSSNISNNTNSNIKGIYDQTDNNSNSSQPSNHWTLTSTESSDDFDDEYNN